MMILNEVAALTDEIQQDTGLDTDAAAALAWSLISDLLDGVDENTRYVPCRVVMFEPFSARELIEWTNRE